MNILLVEPNFPIPSKSKNHKNFLPIGLLKIASCLRAKGEKVRLVRGYAGRVQLEGLLEFNPSEVWVTSLFTYWSRYVKETVEFYKRMFPGAKVVVGGIYASLMPKQCKTYTGCDDVWTGIYEPAESYFPAYELVAKNNSNEIDYQIVHLSRGCVRRCAFCGTWRIEPELTAKRSIEKEIKYRKIVFYDNNLLANPHIENVLSELVELKKRKKILWCEAQSGFDGKILEECPELGRMIKQAGFRYPRIAWDGDYQQLKSIKRQIDFLVSGGYNSRDIFVFMLYNWDVSFEEMENKRVRCWEWQVQIADCRYRPLKQTFDDYDPRKNRQTNRDYYIHEVGGWTDELIRQFRRNVRRQNICVRHRFPFYSVSFERKRVQKNVMRTTIGMRTNREKTQYLEENAVPYWLPGRISHPPDRSRPANLSVMV